MPLVPWSSRTKVEVDLSAALSPAYLSNSARASVPPSVSNVTRSTSVVTVMCSRGAAGAAAAPPAALGGTAMGEAGVAVVAGLGSVLGAGTLDAPAGPLAVAAGWTGVLGKNVGFAPL